MGRFLVYKGSKETRFEEAPKPKTKVGAADGSLGLLGSPSGLYPPLINGRKSQEKSGHFGSP
jgi:hypothetical protein